MHVPLLLHEEVIDPQTKSEINSCIYSRLDDISVLSCKCAFTRLAFLLLDQGACTHSSLLISSFVFSFCLPAHLSYQKTSDIGSSTLGFPHIRQESRRNGMAALLRAACFMRGRPRGTYSLLLFPDIHKWPAMRQKQPTPGATHQGISC